MSVNNAIEHICESTSGKSMSEMFDDLGQQIIANAFAIIKRSRETGVGITQEEKKWQDEAQYQFNIIERTFRNLKKNGRISDAANKDFDEQLHEKIKEENHKQRSTVAQIVTMIPVNDK